MNRRQILQSLCGIAASVFATARFTVGNVSDSMFSSDLPVRDSLINLLQATVDHCCALNSATHGAVAIPWDSLHQQSVRTGQLCRIAKSRLQNSVADTPAFWQACVDCVARMEVELLHSASRSNHATQEFAATLNRLQASLSEHNQVVIERCTVHN